MKNSKTLLTPTLITSFIAVLCNILWGTPFPILKIVYKDMHIASSNFADNLSFISLRFIQAGFLLFLFGLASGAPLFKINKHQFLLIIILGFFSTTLQYFFFNIGINNTSGIKASILGQIAIFFSILLAHFVYKDDKLTIQKCIGLVLGFGGLILVNLNKGSEGFMTFSLFGEGFMIFAGLASALAMFIAKKLGSELSALVFTCWQMLTGSSMLLVVGISMGGNPMTLHFTSLSVTLLFYLALVSSVSSCLWYTLLKYRKIGELSMFQFIIPVTGSLLTVLLIPGETLLPVHLIALLLVSGGIIIVNKG